MPSDEKERTPYETMVGKYGGQIDFKDDRFMFIPGDIAELLDEIDRLYPRMEAIARGHVPNEKIIRELDFLHSHLWHLIGHAQSLDAALQALELKLNNEDDRAEKGDESN